MQKDHVVTLVGLEHVGLAHEEADAVAGLEALATARLARQRERLGAVPRADGLETAEDDVELLDRLEVAVGLGLVQFLCDDP